QANHPLAHPVVLQPAGEVGLRLAALSLVHTPVPPQLGMGHHGMPPGEQFHLGHGLVPGGWCVGIFGFLAGEQGHHHLLHGVLVLVAHQIQLHPRLMASSMQKLVVRSRSRVEEPSWPGNTRQSPGSWARRLSEASSWVSLPPSKSVRPMEPSKRVSPVNRASSTWSTTPPGVWPGVWSTWTVRPPTGTVSPSW